MKFLLNTLVLVFSASLFTNLAAQKSWTFKHEFAPATKYYTDMQMDVDMDMKMELPSETKNEIADAIPDSISMSMMMFFGLAMETGQAGENGLPFKITYDSIRVNSMMNGEKIEVPDNGPGDMLQNMVVNGRIVDNEMELDSMAGAALTPEMMASLEANLQGVQMMIDFPKRPLMIGDTFSQVNEQQISAGTAGSMAIEVLWTLKLESVEGEIATFSTTEEYNFDGAAEEGMGALMDLGGEGVGLGTMTFHRGESRIVSYTNDSEMNMRMDMTAQTGMDMKMDAATKNHMVVTTKIVN